MSRRGRGRAIALVAVLSCGTAALGATGHEGTARVLEYRDDRLTLRVEHAPVDRVVADVARETGAELQGSVRLSREVTADFERVPIAEALHRLLGGQNFTLIYGRGDRLRVIELLGMPKPRQVSGKMPSSASPPGAPIPALGMAAGASGNQSGLGGIIRRHPPVPISGRLARALGTNRAALEQLVQAGLQNDDARVRTKAMRVFLRAVETDQEWPGLALALRDHMDDAAFGTFMRNAAGPYAEDVLANIASTTGSAALREKATQVLAFLRAHPVPGGTAAR